MKVLYPNADQFISKQDDMAMLICRDEPDLILLTEVIPKVQKAAICSAVMTIPGYVQYLTLPYLKVIGIKRPVGL